jgi:nucleotide-binding universal stress UspA family protein
MTAIDKIVFPVNFSDACRAATPYIADITNRFEAELRLLHVIAGKQSLAYRFAQKCDELKTFANSLPNSMRWPRAVAHGEPAQEIARYAETQGADLIAMAVSGNGYRRSAGSTALGVLQNASCAVWTETGTGAPHVRWSPILCAVDLKPGSEQTLRYAASVAETLGAKLFVVHALTPAPEGVWTYPAELPAVLSKTEAREELESLLEGVDVHAEPLIETGAVYDVLRGVAAKTHAKLLVVGRGGDRKGAVGANTYELVRSAPCPVLTCAPLPRQRGEKECFWTEGHLDAEPAYA